MHKTTSPFSPPAPPQEEMQPRLQAIVTLQAFAVLAAAMSPKGIMKRVDVAPRLSWAAHSDALQLRGGGCGGCRRTPCICTSDGVAPWQEHIGLYGSKVVAEKEASESSEKAKAAAPEEDVAAPDGKAAAVSAVTPAMFESAAAETAGNKIADDKSQTAAEADAEKEAETALQDALRKAAQEQARKPTEFEVHYRCSRSWDAVYAHYSLDDGLPLSPRCMFQSDRLHALQRKRVKG